MPYYVCCFCISVHTIKEPRFKEDNLSGWISTYYKCIDDKINLTCFGSCLAHQVYSPIRIFFLSPCLDSCQVSSFTAVTLNPYTYFSLREKQKEKTHFLTGTCLCMSHVILSYNQSRMRIYIEVYVARVLLNIV